MTRSASFCLRAVTYRIFELRVRTPRRPGSHLIPQRLEASRPADIYSLAVLPLRDLSADGTENYFSDGMTEALITRLAKRGSVRVISRTSVMQYKDIDRPLADIARELGASHIIEGSVLRIGDKIRITAQLIEAATDHHVWAESYQRNFSEVLALQDEVVGRIVASLPGQSVPPSDVAATGLPAIDPAAYEANLRGRYFLNKMTEEGFRKGIAYFDEAIEKAPEFAPAHSGMATCYCLLGGHGFELVKPSEGMPTAKKAVLEALRLDDSLAEPHAFLGIIRLKYEWDWPGAEQSFKRSIELNPSYAQARIFYSFYLEAMGQQEAAVHEAERARAGDPLSRAANINLGWQYLQAGRLEEARQVMEKTAELDATFWGVHWGLGHYHRLKGDYGEAIAAFQKAAAAGGGHALPLSALGYTYAIAGQAVQARTMLDRLTTLARDGYVSPFNNAIIHAGLGDKENAFAWLEMAYAERSRSMAWLNVTKELEGLRADPRFESLLRRIGHLQ
jgi:TolB-like protein/Tfp pilus assembly protein PilF